VAPAQETAQEAAGTRDVIVPAHDLDQDIEIVKTSKVALQRSRRLDGRPQARRARLGESLESIAVALDGDAQPVRVN